MCETISDTVIKCELLNIDYINSSDQTIEEFGYTQDIDPPVKCEIIDVRSECEHNSSDIKPVHQKFPFSAKAILATEHIEEDVDGNDMIKALRAQNSHRNRIIGYRCKWNECDFANRLLKQVEMHVRSKHTKNGVIMCELCEMGCLSSEALKQHKADKHSNIFYSFVCDYPECSFITNRKQNLQNHMNCHSKPYVCDWPECGQRFSRNYLLTNHQKGLHERQYRFRCDWTGCDKVYTSRRTLDDHKAIHTGKKYVCIWPGCEYIANSRSCLRAHKKKHLGIKTHKKMYLGVKKKGSTHLVSTLDRRFVCNWPECGKKFAKNWNLAKHMRIHSGERPFKCEWSDCQRSFAEQGNMIKHMRTHNKVKHQK